LNGNAYPRDLYPALCTEDGLPYELDRDEQAQITQVKDGNEPPNDLPPGNESRHHKSDPRNKIVDHLLRKEMRVDLMDQIGRDNKQRNKLQDKKVGEMFKDTSIKIKQRFHTTSFRDSLYF
jgi:hypothetical protein